MGTASLARESILYMFQLSEHGLGVSVYTWVKGGGSAGYAVFIYGGNPDGSTMLDHVDGIPVGADVGFDRWNLERLALSQSPTSEVSTIKAGTAQCAIEFTFEPTHEPYLYSTSPGGCPSFFGTDRLEQSGRIRGRLERSGEIIEFDTQGHHDHSWGTRDWRAIQHYKWFEATSPTSAVHVLDIAGIGEHHVAGYVLRDQKFGEVRSARWDVQYGDQFFQNEISLTVVDEFDRQTVVRGKSFSNFEFPVDAETTLMDSLLDLTIEGEAGSGFADWCWPKDYLGYLQSR